MHSFIGINIPVITILKIIIRAPILNFLNILQFSFFIILLLANNFFGKIFIVFVSFLNIGFDNQNFLVLLCLFLNYFIIIIALCHFILSTLRIQDFYYRPYGCILLLLLLLIITIYYSYLLIIILRLFNY